MYRGAPLCPVAVPEIFRSLFASQNFDRCHSFLLPSSATGGGRKRPHFDTSACEKYLLRCSFEKQSVIQHKTYCITPKGFLQQFFEKT